MAEFAHGQRPAPLRNDPSASIRFCRYWRFVLGSVCGPLACTCCEDWFGIMECMSSAANKCGNHHAMGLTAHTTSKMVLVITIDETTPALQTRPSVYLNGSLAGVVTLWGDPSRDWPSVLAKAQRKHVWNGAGASAHTQTQILHFSPNRQISIFTLK